MANSKEYINKSSPVRRLVIVSGMHRSGTSAITRVLNICGLTLPNSLLVPVAGENDTGYWESQSVMELHDEIFNLFGYTWSSLGSIPASWFSSKQAELYRERLIGILKAQFEEFNIGLIKDPRICKLVPLWESVLAEMGVQSHYIICLRNPLEIAKSLENRNRFELQYALSLWFINLRLFESGTRNLRRVFVRYEDILQRYENVIQHVNYHLDTELQFLTPEIKKQVNSFLSDSLRHYKYDSSELKMNSNVPSVVNSFYQWLESQASLNGKSYEPDNYLSLEEVLNDTADTNFSLYLDNVDLLEKQIDQKLIEIEEYRAVPNQKMESERAVLLQQIRSNEVTIATYRNAFSEQEKQIQNYKVTIATSENAFAEQKKQIELLEKVRKESLVDKSKLRFKLTKFQAKSITEKKRRKQTQDKYKGLSRLNEKAIENLKTIELRLHDQKQTGAWKIGIRAVALIRKIRLSILGKLCLWIRAIATLEVKEYREILSRYRIVNRSGLFDEDYYLEIYPLIAYSYKSPLQHYVENGEAEGRQPNRAFKPYFYASQIARDTNSWNSPLVHYIKEGARLDLDPNPDFSNKAYRKKHAVGNETPLAHYLRSSRKKLDSKPNLLSRLNHRAVDRLGSNRFGVSGDSRVSWEMLSEPYALDRNTKLNYLMNMFDGIVSENPLVSLVIPVFNQLDLTIHCLWSLTQFQTKATFEVIVVNDCSTDETREVLGLIPRLRLLQTDENSGFVISSNLGAAAARGQYTLFLNNDTAVLENWLDELVDVFRKIPEAGYVCSKLLYPDKSLQEAGCVVWNDGSAWNIGRNGDPLKPEYNYLRDTHYGSGCSVMTPTSLLQEIGYFDLQYRPGYYEDVDYAYKVRRAGRRVIYQPTSLLIHFEGQTGGVDTASGVKKYQIINRESFKQNWLDVLAHEAPETTPLHKVDNQGAKLQVLFIEPTHLTPDQDAGSAMSFNLILALVKMRIKVTFVTSEGFSFDEHYTKTLQAAGVECLYRPYYKSLKDVFSERPDAWDFIFIARLHCILQVYEEVRSANPSAKIIFQTIDLSSLRERRELELGASSRSLEQVELKEKLELKYIEACDKSIIVSGFEKEMLAKYGLGDKVVTMPLLAYDYCEPTLNYRQGVMFIGGFRHQPNVDAVQFLAKEIAPLVLQKQPKLIFYIVGGDASLELKKLSSPNMVFVGQIQQPDSFFLKMRLSIAPLRYGAGIKGKVIQSMAAGLPCVGTPIALEGIGSPEETGVYIADDAIGIAEGIVKLYSDDQAWNEASLLGYQFSREHYTKESLENDVAHFLQSVV